MFPPPPSWSTRFFSIGVTGTNGKTTTTTYLARALECLHAPVVRVTTVGSFIGQEKLDVSADYDGFLESMRIARDAGAKIAVLECTSEALAVGFAKAWPLSMGVFTNLSRDHLDSHGSPEHYLASKAQLFMHLPPGGVAILNAYDPASALLAEIIPPEVRVVSYGLPSRSSGKSIVDVDVSAENIRVGWQGTRFDLRLGDWFASTNQSVNLQAIGDIYVENALAALAAAVSANVSVTDAIQAIERTPIVQGRFEVFGAGPRGVVDYGHSPDALERTLRIARELCKGRLVVVFGAGGGRDQGKRGAMGQAARIADSIVLTTDNPRNEDPLMIIEAIRQGIGTHPSIVVNVDREMAIAAAFEGLSSEDVVVVAGRGPETHQISAAGRHFLVDADIVRRALGWSSRTIDEA